MNGSCSWRLGRPSPKFLVTEISVTRSLCHAFPVLKELESNVEYGEAVFALLKRKAENQLELIAPAHSEQVVEFWRALLAMHEVQVKLDRERHRLSVLQG